MNASFKLALRRIGKAPVVTAVAVLSLALGIGANAAIFSLFDQMVLRSLPVHEPDRLVNLANPGPKPGSQSCNQAGDCDEVFSYPMFRDLEEQLHKTVAGVAAHRLFGANLADDERTVNGQGMLVSGSYFSLLGLQPAYGRLIGPEQVVGPARPGRDDVGRAGHADDGCPEGPAGGWSVKAVDTSCWQCR